MAMLNIDTSVDMETCGNASSIVSPACRGGTDALGLPIPCLSAGSFDPAAPVKDRSRCNCCPPLAEIACNRRDAWAQVQTLSVLADPCEVSNTAVNIETALLSVFGENGLESLFGCRDPSGAKRIAQGGMNHLFMVAHNGLLAKCMKPPNTWASEAAEAGNLLAAHPKLAEDVHALAPIAAFVCQAAPGSGAAATMQTPTASGSEEASYEVLVFKYLDGCRPLDEVLQIFQRTHACGVLQSTAICVDFQRNGTCDHIPLLRHLLVSELPKLCRRFHALYGRRHGDFKVGNVMLERSGNLRLADFLSPFCRNCDLEEFLASTKCLHNVVMEMRDAFHEEWVSAEKVTSGKGWQQSQQADYFSRSGLDQRDVDVNLKLLNALDELNAARVASGNSFFGPMPSLLDSIPGLKAPTLSFLDNAQQGDADGLGDLSLPLSPSVAPSGDFQPASLNQDGTGSKSFEGIGHGFSFGVPSPNANLLFRNTLDGNSLLQNALDGKPMFQSPMDGKPLFPSTLEGNSLFPNTLLGAQASGFGGQAPGTNAGFCPPSLSAAMSTTNPAFDSIGSGSGSQFGHHPWPSASALDASQNSGMHSGAPQPRIVLPMPSLAVGCMTKPACNNFPMGHQADAPHRAPVLSPASDGIMPHAHPFGLPPPQLQAPFAGAFAAPPPLAVHNTPLFPPQGGFGNFTPLAGMMPIGKECSTHLGPAHVSFV
mmetsp:Transcript_28205/g.51904  ORF Transcript_28205/g.51904 Transcript_28205/m.51904 type:complete len:709 (+) Transcript_28205:92-2218(+)